MWDEGKAKEISNLYTITALAWKKDGSRVTAVRNFFQNRQKLKKRNPLGLAFWAKQRGEHTCKYAKVHQKKERKKKKLSNNTN